MYNIQITTMREAKVTNLETKVTKTCKVEPYHRDGKPMAYVVMHEDLQAPIKRFNITDFTGPKEMKNVNLQARSRNTHDWSFWGKKGE